MGHIVNGVYGDYSGRPYTQIGAEVIFDDGRSYVRRSQEHFDVIQLSLIDTFSLNASGGFVFSENYLYTTEAFEEYFRHLTDQGILSVTRYFVPKYPVEILRLLAMVSAAWRAEGVTDPAQHIVVLNQGFNGTLLAKRTPFTAEEIDKLKALAAENHINVLYTPGSTDGHREIRDLLTSADPAGYIEGYPFLIYPPTDDRPFFFHFLRGRLPEEPSKQDDPFVFLIQWNHALALMYLLIFIVAGLAGVFFFGSAPAAGAAWDEQRAGTTRRTAAAVLRLSRLRLHGHRDPAHAAADPVPRLPGLRARRGAVRAAALLRCRRAAQQPVRRRQPARRHTRADGRRGAVVALRLLPARHPAPDDRIPIAMKIVVSVLLLAPIGMALGMAYPLGITILRRVSEGLVPWAWGLNGALSVVASVFAIFISSRVGFTATMITGSITYFVALM